jgi:co-chaperonin GroES (HSP10)
MQTTNPTKIHPVANRILIRYVEAKRDIILPDNITESLDGWDVIEVGEDVKVCRPGDRVLLIAHANLMGVDDKNKIALADAGVVIATIK